MKISLSEEIFGVNWIKLEQQKKLPADVKRLLNFIQNEFDCIDSLKSCEKKMIRRNFF